MTTKQKLIAEIKRRMEVYRGYTAERKTNGDYYGEFFYMGAGKALASLLRYVESIMED